MLAIAGVFLRRRAALRGVHNGSRRHVTVVGGFVECWR
jgi:hypothetical protein